ncbi:MAG: Teichoic acid translocation permease protein TagG [Pelotomaculum sp. PtaU1.Bin065]|nr:MAG: Teichoic acid translocation permease protein TagG [Pelotomaculum sp. PtaU1.Bin065]
MFLANPLTYWEAVKEVFNIIYRSRQLIWEMSKREITDRYAGQFIGTIWAIGHPLFIMGIYAVVFTLVFKVKAGETFELPLDYTAYLISGYLPLVTYHEVMSKACSAITGSSNLVKQVVFPIEILPVKSVLASLFTQIIGTIFLVLYILVKTGPASLPWTYILLLPVLLIHITGMIGISFFLSSISVYFRDMKDFILVFSVANMYIVPMFYLPEWVPEKLAPILKVNPFSHLIWVFQDICYFGRVEHPVSWFVFMGISLASIILGYQVFRKTKVGFGNVL